MSDKITLEQLKQVHKKIEEAREDDTPYAIYVEEDEPIKVVGDANKTEVKKSDYVITFRFEKDEIDMDSLPDDVKILFDRYVQFSVEYKDIYINARNDMKLNGAFIDVQPFMVQLGEILVQREDEIEKIEKKYSCKFLEKNKKIVTTLKDKEKNDKAVRERSEIVNEAERALVGLYLEEGDKVQDSLYEFVALLLNIDKFHAEHMTPVSVITAVVKIILTNPEFINENESVFGS